MEKSRLKALYLSVIDRIDIKKDGNHKKQFYVTLKLNNEIIKQLFNNKQLDEVHLSTSSLFFYQTLHLSMFLIMSYFYLKNTKGSEYYEYNQKHHTHRSNF